MFLGERATGRLWYNLRFVRNPNMKDTKVTEFILCALCVLRDEKGNHAR
jgi:hypothetical protein